MNGDFDTIEKYAVTKGENYNNDRCLLVTIPKSSKKITLCMDEIQSEIHICKKNNKDIELKDKVEVRGLLNNIEVAAITATYTAIDEQIYTDYLEEIKTTEDCCEDCSTCLNFKCNN